MSQPTNYRTGSPELGNLRCPRCNELMFVGRGSDMELHGCGCCGGVFLSNEDSRRLLEAYPIAAVELADRAERVARGAYDERAPARCPSCEAPMTRTFVDKANLDLDVCKEHGTWFDRGEMQRVARALNMVPTPATGAGAPVPYLASAGGPELEGDAGIYMRGFRVLLGAAGTVLGALATDRCCHCNHPHHQHHGHRH